MKKQEYVSLVVFSLFVYMLASYIPYKIFKNLDSNQSFLVEGSLLELFSLKHILVIIKNTLGSNVDFYIKSFIGYFGWLDYHLTSIFYYIYVFSAALLMKYLSRDSIYEKFNSNLIILSGTLFLSVGIIFVGFYISYLDKYKDVIWGVQGRYFLVLLPFLLLLGGGLLRTISSNKRLRIICIILLFLYILFELLYAILRRYYVI